MIAGTLAASEGTAERVGRVAALLELGLGFNGDFTGRQNAATYLAMLGSSQSEIASLMPSLEGFAEIGEYFDRPVRTYSSGMQMRVAFAAATAIRPDILIVDEALAVGDSYFVHKCMSRIREFCDVGTTLLFVSHDPGSVRSLCDRAVLLDHGRMLKDGSPDEVCDFYNALIAKKENEASEVSQARNVEGWLATRSGSRTAMIQSVKLVCAKNNTPVKLALVNQPLKLLIVASLQSDIEHLVVGVMIKDRLGHIVWGSNTWHTKQTAPISKSGEAMICEMVFPCAFGPGSYGVTVALHRDDQHVSSNFDWMDNALVFDVMIGADMAQFIGTSHIPVQFEMHAVEVALTRAP
jgi:lipopolysaccharide transport system ATP-binding protein